MSYHAMVPVLIVVYDRLEHLQKTVASLRSNVHAEQTDLFIASDYQRSESDADKVAAVRNYLKSVDGFKSVTVFGREKNYGPSKNVFLALEYILEKFDRFILMEDDVLPAPGFLKFMNEAFENYGENEKVFSISGYCPPIKIPPSYQYDAFFLGRMSAWGCGMTRERYESVLEITRREYDEFAANNKLRRAFVKGGGDDMLEMLKHVAYGSLEAWDVRCMYTQFLNNQYTVYPTQSQVLNIGFDGTGMHCGKTDRFNVTLSNKTTFRFPDAPFVDPRIVRANLAFRNGSTYARLRARIASKTRMVIRRPFR